MPIRIDLLSFQRLQKTRSWRCRMDLPPAHARNHVVLLKEPHICARGVLDAMIGMMHQSRWRMPLCYDLLQRRDRQPGGQRADRGKVVAQNLIQQQKSGEEGELIDALERYAWSWEKLFAFPVGKTWTELKRFWFARSDITTWVGAGEALESLPFSWLISTWERICDGEKVRVEDTYIWATPAGLDSCCLQGI